MPKAAPRPCTQPGCKEYQVERGRCATHPRKAWNRYKDGSSHQRGYGQQWRRLRESILIREEYICQPCLSEDRVTPASEVDHITPKARGGTDSPDNLQAICAVCHRIKTARESNTRGGVRS